MVVALCFGVWRTFMFAFLLCAHKQTVPAGAHLHLGTEFNNQHQMEEDTDKSQGTSSTANSFNDKLQPGKEKVGSAGIDSRSGSSTTQEVVLASSKNDSQQREGAGTEEEEDVKMRSQGKESMLDGQVHRGETLPEVNSHSDDKVEDKKLVPTDQQENSNKRGLQGRDKLQEDEHVPFKQPRSDSQGNQIAEIEDVDTSKETSSLDLQNVRNVVDVDTRTQQINQKASTRNLDKTAATQAMDSQESVPTKPKSKEDVPQDSSELLKQTDLASKDLSSKKDTDTDSVKIKDGSPKDTLASETPKETLEEKTEDTFVEVPRDAKEDIVIDKNDTLKKVEEHARDEGEKGELEEGKKDATQKEEEMPSFDEWKQKMLEQHEQERQHGQAGQGSAAPPPRPFSLTENSKNHASSDCGAKILNVNKESQNAPAILQSNRDVYTLNPCTANIWFTVELCEPIQVKYLEIANYELFSSVPESFRVSISDRFPTREWRQLGTFQAREERSLQSFPVHEEQMFAKYMKIEMLTFFGNEHYCPLSTLRVFGTSMVEEIEEENIAHEESDVLPAHPTPVPEEGDNGLLQSAKGLVRNLMNVITGNGKDTTRCENDSKSCSQADELLPCMPEDAPKELQSNVLAVEEQEAHQCHAQNASSFSLDPIQFHKECHGSTWCFSPNYGDKYQDCCVRGVAAPVGTTQLVLCCKDILSLSLYRSVHIPEPSIVKDSLQSPKQVKEPKKTVADQVKVTLKESVSNVTPGNKLGVSKDQIQHEGMPQEDSGTSTIDAKSSVPSSSSSSHTLVHRQPVSQMKLTSSSSTQEVATVERGSPIPSPTPSVKTTCSTLPEGQPEVVLLPPISIVREESKLQDQIVPERVPSSESPAVDKDSSSTQSVVASPVADSLTVSDKDNIKVSEQSAEVSNEPHVKAQDDEPTPTEMEPLVASTGIASKDVQFPDDTEKPDHTATLDKSRQGDAAEKEPGKTQESEEAKKSIKTETKETIEMPKVESIGNIPENIKTETTGKGTKAAIPDTGSNGINTIGSIAQKESVFMRLNNRIKSLELNMSLSSRYLEELSQRYRKQMDEMQKAFNKTIKTLTENAQKAEEKDQKQQEYITRLEGQMSEVMINLETTNQRLDGLHKEVIERHLFFMVVEIILISIVFFTCMRRFRQIRHVPNHSPPVVRYTRDNGLRRNSLPVASPTKEQKNDSLPRVGKRTISGGSCDDLLIIGPSTPFLESLKQANEPLGHKPKNKAKHKPTKSISNTPLQHSHQSSISSKRTSKMTIAGVLFKGSAFGGGHTPPDSPTDPVHRTVSAEELQSRVQDIKRGAPPIKQQRPKVSNKQTAKKHGLLMNGRR